MLHSSTRVTCNVAWNIFLWRWLQRGTSHRRLLFTRINWWGQVYGGKVREQTGNFAMVRHGPKQLDRLLERRGSMEVVSRHLAVRSALWHLVRIGRGISNSRSFHVRSRCTPRHQSERRSASISLTRRLAIALNTARSMPTRAMKSSRRYHQRLRSRQGRVHRGRSRRARGDRPGEQTHD